MRRLSRAWANANLLFIATVILELENAQDAELTLFLVEEPEAHLHPQLQAVLLDYLLGRAKASVVGGDEHGPMGRIEILATWALRARTFGGPLSDRVVVRSGKGGEQRDRGRGFTGPGLRGDGETL